ncbi:YcxB family protein [Paenibacillus sp.]|uniref:YcxB family protein n=1 Tax=Paenibacillus sp. TaxID=58172 RepID=UPI002822782D|nr:YcxB family protein [Paenibacillus sp.]MDR0269109.1 YcxB family protein [Paenibacillus sp.]
MNHEIVVESSLELKDVQELNLFFTRTSRVMLAVIFFVVFIGIILLVEGKLSGTLFGIVVLLDILVSLMLWFVNGWSIRRKSIKAFLSDQLIRQLHTFVFSGEGIQYASKSETGKMFWTDIYEVRESRNLFLILLSTSRSLIVPKKFFASEPDRAAFRNMVETNLEAEQVHWHRMRQNPDT